MNLFDQYKARMDRRPDEAAQKWAEDICLTKIEITRQEHIDSFNDGFDSARAISDPLLEEALRVIEFYADELNINPDYNGDLTERGGVACGKRARDFIAKLKQTIEAGEG